jgi:16S rRNA (guanine1207-N2)-methyltransferase
MSKVNQPALLLTALLPNESSFMGSHNLLLLGSGDGMLAVHLAKLVTSCQFWATDLTASSIQLTNKAAQANELSNIHVFPDLADPKTYLRDVSPEQFDTAIIVLPKGRKVARRWLLQAFRCLKGTGILYLAGANDEGIQSFAKDTGELFTQVNVLGYKKGSRIYRAVKYSPIDNLPDWAHEPGIALGTWNEFSLEIRGRAFTIHSLPGVFSFDHLDDGTQMLLDCMQIPTDSQVLDIGCGCGIIGMVAAHLGAGQVYLSDNHILSVASTTENIHLNSISSAYVYASDLYASLPDVKYDMILSNPPFHTGKEVDYQVAQAFIAQGHQKLKPGGSLLIVANRFIRYERLMQQIFNNVSILQENGKFHVLSSQKR